MSGYELIDLPSYVCVCVCVCLCVCARALYTIISFVYDKYHRSNSNVVCAFAYRTPVLRVHMNSITTAEGNWWLLRDDIRHPGLTHLSDEPHSNPWLWLNPQHARNWTLGPSSRCKTNNMVKQTRSRTHIYIHARGLAVKSSIWTETRNLPSQPLALFKKNKEEEEEEEEERGERLVWGMGLREGWSGCSWRTWSIIRRWRTVIREGVVYGWAQ